MYLTAKRARDWRGLKQYPKWRDLLGPTPYRMVSTNPLTGLRGLLGGARSVRYAVAQRTEGGNAVTLAEPRKARSGACAGYAQYKLDIRPNKFPFLV
jgi:hypothetical protein